MSRYAYIKACSEDLQAQKKEKKLVPKKIGRKTVITKKLINQVHDLKENQKMPITQIARITGKGRSTIYKILKQHLGYTSSYKLTKEAENH